MTSEFRLKVGVYRWPKSIVRRWFADCGCGWHAKRRITKYHAKIDARRHSDQLRHNCRYPLAVK
jgi:hypothetical protein